MVKICEIHDVDRAASLAALAARTFPLACPPGSDPDDIATFISENLSTQRFTDYICDPRRAVLCAQEDAEPIAYSVLVRDSAPPAPFGDCLTYRPTIELNKFYVLPERHGTDVAAKLMEAALRTGQAAGASGIWLGVNQKNDRAIRFYSRSGFSTVGERTFQVGRRAEHDFIMEQAL